MSGYHHRRRKRVSWLVVFAVLFQQLAMSAYACTLTMPAPAAVAVMADCPGMPMAAAHSSPLCDKHCNPDRATASSLLAITVPALGLPPPGFALITNPPTHVDRRTLDVPVSRSDPPPLRRFCSLQI